MHQLSVIFTVLSVFLLSILAASLPLVQSLDKRQNYGRGTWFYDSTNESACGYWDKDSDSIVAISGQIFGSGGDCGRWIWVSANGKTAYAKVADRCQGCGPGDLDMSTSLFQQFSDLNTGVLSIAWGYS